MSKSNESLLSKLDEKPKSKQSFLSKLLEKFEPVPRTNLSGTATVPTTTLSGTVFVQTDVKLNSATSFSQYIYNKKILITIIGELHKIQFTCDKPSVSIPDYCSSAVNYNAKCKIFLEFNENEQIEDLNWEKKSTIKQTCEYLNRPLTYSKYSKIIRFDERPTLITRKYQNFLYWANWQDMRHWQAINIYDSINIYDAINQYYIESFEIKLFESSKFNNQESYTHLQIYSLRLKTKLEIIKRELEINKSKFESQLEDVKSYLADIQGKLQYFWSEVCDFYLLQKLFITDDNECNECIVLVGEAHKRNICDLLDTFNKPNKIYEKLNDSNATGYDETDDSKKKCVNIFRTLMF